MLIVRRVLVDVGRLFVQVALYPAAARRIKLRNVADFHPLFVIPSGVEESLAVLRVTSPLFFQLAEIAFGFHRRRTAGAGGRDRLLVNTIGNVAGDKDAGMFAFHESLCDQISIGIGLEFSRIRFGVWIMPDRDKNTG